MTEQQSAADNADVRVLVEVDELSLETARLGEVVGIEYGDVVAARQSASPR